MDAIPRAQAAHVELCSLGSLLKTVDSGNPAWLGLIRCTDASLTTMEVVQGPEVGESSPQKSRWDAVCERFPTLFTEPGKPPKRAAKHRMEVVEGSKPADQRLYRMSPAELEVRR